MTTRFAVTLVLLSLATGLTALAQQSAGDKEIGIGGQAFFTHTSDFTGMAVLQGSFGYFPSKKNYFGFEVDPVIVLQRSSGKSSIDFSGFTSASYRRFLGSGEGKLFPFFGGGCGGFFSGGSSGNSAQGLAFFEAGLKDYVTQKTSLEFAYRFSYLPASVAVLEKAP